MLCLPLSVRGLATVRIALSALRFCFGVCLYLGWGNGGGGGVVPIVPAQVRLHLSKEVVFVITFIA